MAGEYRKPPFSIDRGRRGNLAAQIADGLRRSIQTGFYKPGEPLPPIRALSSMLEVGRVNVERAVASLTEEGLLNPRPKVGSVVCGAGDVLWKGQVLIVVPPGASNPLVNVISGMLRDELTKAGYLFLIASVPRRKNGSFDFAMLKTVLRQRVDLVILLHDKKEIAERLSLEGVPFIRLTSDGCRPEHCVGLVRFDAAAAFSGFEEHCRRVKPKSVLLASLWDEMIPKGVLEIDGIGAEKFEIGRSGLFAADGASIAELAVELFDRRLRDYGRGWLPDVLYLADDYFAMGALTALLSHGIRVPEDVRAVVWANKGGGCGPVFTKRFTRIEVDIRSCGTKVVESALQYLRTGAFPDTADASPVYISGDTFM